MLNLDELGLTVFSSTAFQGRCCLVPNTTEKSVGAIGHSAGLGLGASVSGSRASGILNPASYSLSALGGGEETLNRANIVNQSSPAVQVGAAGSGALRPEPGGG